MRHLRINYAVLAASKAQSGFVLIDVVTGPLSVFVGKFLSKLCYREDSLPSFPL